MARSAKGHQEELDDDDEEHFTADTSSPHKVKLDESNSGKRVNPHRSKHSETEQRRRSKINERFQVLRDLIPQNDQKRDKASFLLEVIEYIQFLQEKLQIYEQTCEGWNQEPTKLIPWRGHHGPAENKADTSQAMQNGSAHEKNDVSPLLPKNVQNPIESDLSTTTIQKGHTIGSAVEAVPMGMQMRLDAFDPVVSSSMPNQRLHQPISNADMSFQIQPQVLFSKPSSGNYMVSDNVLMEHEELTNESESQSISNAYSQGVLDTLTQALQSSGVDLSQTSVSVQIDVGRRSNPGFIPSASSSKVYGNQFVTNRVNYCSEDSDQSLKRLRRDAT
ncbi:hypothetical protein HN51_067913 [Arachis hypogaea]|uniref:transcription factor BIM3 n=1 Tax=Arachis hypogaea TaxID=3818 RepID=UPI0007AF4936|nr:transcription factor BIM3 isoform X1 [Arachis ipaensis]XP_025650119.1 transcription factor BIM3 isoform X1 [Arachis hypogaea]